MIKEYVKRLQDKERAWRYGFSHDIDDPRERRKSMFYFNWIDHAALRALWHNQKEIVPGVWRSNHPDHERFVKIKEMGINTILNLRGDEQGAPYKFEVESCEILGLDLITVPMIAREAPRKAILLQLMDVFETINKPLLMHCKSGADRTGLAAAIYLLHIENAPFELAMKELSVRHLHLRHTSTGILDDFLELYEKRVQEQGQIPFRRWLEEEYDEPALAAEYARRKIKV